MTDVRKQAYRAATEHREPERFECDALPAYDFAPTRRELFRLLGAGFLVVALTSAARGDEEKTRTDEGQAPANSVGARLHIAQDGTISILTGKMECGQGARTLMAQAAAEELRVPLERVRVVMADTALVPDDGGTWGSLTTPQTIPAVRRAAAAARVLLVEAAAERWHQPAAGLQVEAGQVIGAGGQRLGYGELATGKLLGREVPADPPLTAAAAWRVLGQSPHSLNGRAIVTGAQQYPSDLRVPDMRHGRVVRSTAYQAKLTALAGEPAGAQVVRDGNFAGVVAASPAAAEAATAQLTPQWQTQSLPARAELPRQWRTRNEPPIAQPGARYPALLQQGSLALGRQSAVREHKASYSLQYIAHVPLEPRAALAEWGKNAQGEETLTVRCGSQAPFLVRQDLARAFGLPEGRVRVIVHDTGSGYGGKHRGECEIEAARLAKAAGKPVKLAWSREEEFTRSYLRPAGVIDVTSHRDARGRVVAWEQRNYNSGASSLATPYAIPHSLCAFHRADSPLQQGSYRSLAAVANTFARELHMEELAAQAEADPLEYRLRHLENARLRHVLERAAERFGWGKRKQGCGLACNLEKDGHLALFVELTADSSNVQLRRMVAAVDVGAVLNPDNLRNQIVGAFIQGIGGALWEQIRWQGDRITNARLSRYRVPRFTDVPDIEVILVDRRDVAPAGAGESPITVVAPAIGAALHSATGEWARALPMRGA